MARKRDSNKCSSASAFERALEAEKREEWDTALREIDLALAEDPQEPVVKMTKATILAGSERSEEAIALLRETLAFDSALDFVWLALARIYYKQDRYEEAAFCYEKCLELPPTGDRRDDVVHTLLADAQLTFDATSALLNAEKALVLNPDWEDAKTVREAARRYIRESQH